MISQKHGVSVILLIAVLISSIAVYRGNTPIQHRPPPKHSPHIIMQDIVATRMNEQGLPQYQFSARNGQYFPDNDTEQFSSPTGIIFAATTQAPWKIKANEAIVRDQFNQVELSGDVFLHQDLEHNNSGNNLKLETLLFYPRKNLALTEGNVVFWQTNTELTAVGMTADLTSGDINLLAKVHTNYESIGNADAN